MAVSNRRQCVGVRPRAFEVSLKSDLSPQLCLMSIKWERRGGAAARDLGVGCPPHTQCVGSWSDLRRSGCLDALRTPTRAIICE
eukprot:16445703-Heterocapsa_arctica.AAC.2